MSLRIGSILNFKRLTSVPSESVASDETHFYSKNDGHLYTRDSTGVETILLDAGFVRVATTGSITLSGTQTIDGVALGVGDRVLVHSQGVFSGNNYDNGVWVVASGAWTRAVDANTSAKIAGRVFFVQEGTYHVNQRFRCTFKSTDTLGTTALAFISESSRAEYGGVFAQPKTADPGQMFFVGGERRLLIWDGTFFSNVKGVSNYGTVAPSFPATGEIWLDSGVTNANATADPFFKGVPVSASQAITAGVNIPFTATEDTHSGWNAGSNYYTIPVSGLYRITGQVKIDGTNTVVSLAIVNGAGSVLTWAPNQPATGGFAGSQITNVLRFTAGQTVALRPQATDALQNDSVENSFFIVEYVRA